MSDRGSHEAIRELLAEYATRLREALEMLTAEPVEIEEIPADEAATIRSASLLAEWPSYVWNRFRLSISPSAVIAVGASELTSKAIGAKVLLAAGIEEMSDRDVSDSYAEVQQSAIAALVHWLSRFAEADLSSSPHQEEMAAPDPGRCFLFRAQVAGQKFDPICLSIPEEVNVLLVTGMAGPQIAVPAPPPPSTGDPIREPVSGAGSDPTISRVLEFELPLRVSFGKAHLPLREVLNLTTGSIIELDRSIADPVEIVVNNRVVGRGEVVVVEGNYGVRIQEIVAGGS